MKHDHTALDAKLMVARGYDRIAEGFLRMTSAAPAGHAERYLDRLAGGLAQGGTVLDLGCGAAAATGQLRDRFRVVGADISHGQLALARRTITDGAFVLGDMCALPFRRASFDAVVALYSIIHVPRTEHGVLLRNLLELLRPRGLLLAVLGATAWEGTEDNWLDLGSELYWSHFDRERNIELVESVGFLLVEASIEPDRAAGGEHLFVLAERPA